MTTRPRFRWAYSVLNQPIDTSVCPWLVLGTVFAAAAPPDSAARGARHVDDVAVVAERPANDVPDANIPDLGSTAGSSGVAGIRGRIPCEGRLADINSGLGWPKPGANRYADPVPWEVVLPWGPPERFL